jgi:hypothetical protein
MSIYMMNNNVLCIEQYIDTCMSYRTMYLTLTNINNIFIYGTTDLPFFKIYHELEMSEIDISFYQ